MKEHTFPTLKHTSNYKRPQRDLNGLKECPHFDGEFCYYHINTQDKNSKYPKDAMLFKCPEKEKWRRLRCQLIN